VLIARVRRVFPYVLSILLGMLTAKLAPASMRLTVFMVCLASIAFLNVAAHTIKTPKEWGRSKTILVVSLGVLLGSAGTTEKGGSAARVFAMSLLHILGFVLVLAVSASAA
jgi:hypothetical protein